MFVSYIGEPCATQPDSAGAADLPFLELLQISNVIAAVWYPLPSLKARWYFGL